MDLGWYYHVPPEAFETLKVLKFPNLGDNCELMTGLTQNITRPPGWFIGPPRCAGSGTNTRKIFYRMKDGTEKSIKTSWDFLDQGIPMSYFQDPEISSVYIFYPFEEDGNQSSEEELSEWNLDDGTNPNESSENDGDSRDEASESSDEITFKTYEEIVNEAIESKTQRTMALNVITSSIDGKSNGYRTMYQQAMNSLYPATLKTCQGMIKEFKSQKTKANVKDLLGEVIELPVFDSVPPNVLNYMVSDLNPETPVDLLPEGSIVFLYDGPLDGESCCEEFKKGHPDLANRVFGFDIKMALREIFLVPYGHDLFTQ